MNATPLIPNFHLPSPSSPGVILPIFLPVNFQSIAVDINSSFDAGFGTPPALVPAGPNATRRSAPDGTVGFRSGRIDRVSRLLRVNQNQIGFWSGRRRRRRQISWIEMFEIVVFA